MSSLREAIADRNSSAAPSPYAPLPAATSQTADFTIPLRFTRALVAVGGLVALITHLRPTMLRDAPVTVGNARGTALTMLLIALPAATAASNSAARGSVRAAIVWLGALCYLAYNATIFTFGTSFSSLFLLYVASLSLSVWSIVTLLAHFPVHEMRTRITSGRSDRVIGAYLFAIAISFALVWAADLGPATLANRAPASLIGTRMTTNPIEALDFAFTLPLSAIAGVWLWKRQVWGYLLAGTMLVSLTIESASVTTDQLFGHLADATQSLGGAAVFAVLTLVGIVPMIALLRRVR